jgi:hypothetical protein
LIIILSYLINLLNNGVLISFFFSITFLCSNEILLLGLMFIEDIENKNDDDDDDDELFSPSYSDASILTLLLLLL